jgi:hypothetical protein
LAGIDGHVPTTTAGVGALRPQAAERGNAGMVCGEGGHRLLC